MCPKIGIFENSKINKLLSQNNFISFQVYLRISGFPTVCKNWEDFWISWGWRANFFAYKMPSNCNNLICKHKFVSEIQLHQSSGQASELEWLKPYLASPILWRFVFKNELLFLFAPLRSNQSMCYLLSSDLSVLHRGVVSPIVWQGEWYTEA